MPNAAEQFSGIIGGQTVAPVQQTPQPQQPSQPQTTQDTSQLDPSIVALMHGLKVAEGTNGNYNAVGDKGTAVGIGQWSNQVNGTPQPIQPGQVPLNFQNQAKQYGFDPNDFSPENQNKVIYAHLSADKKAGLTPEQILSKWNSGDPNKYLNPATSTGVSSVGTYDVGSYVKRGMAAAQQYAQQNKSTPVEQNHDKNFLENITSGNLLGAGKQALDFLFPIVGDIGGDIAGTNKKNWLQQAADLGLSALPFIPGIGEGGGLLKLAGIGAGSGALGSIAQTGKLDAGNIAEGAAVGGLTGGALGGAGALFGKVADMLPQRIARSFLPGINEETAQYAVQKGLGAPEKMLAESEASIKNLGSQLSDAINKKMNTGFGQYKGFTTTIDDLLPKIQQQFPNAGIDAETLGQKLMQVAPNQKTLINKLVSGEGLNLEELHKLNSDVGANTFKSVFDNPGTKAGKAIASSFYHAASDNLKQIVPESAPIFDQFSKEYPLNTALKKLIRSGQKGKAITLKDIVATLGGLSVGGPIGAGATLLGEKAVTNPTVNLRAAGLISKLANVPTAGLLGRSAAVLGGKAGGL